MEHGRTVEARGERTPGERLTEGLTVAVASVLSLGLLTGPVVVFGATAWRLATDTGTTTFSRFLVPVLLLALLALPPALARAVFRSGRRKGGGRLTAAAPATLALLGGAVVPFVVLCLLVVTAD